MGRCLTMQCFPGYTTSLGLIRRLHFQSTKIWRPSPKVAPNPRFFSLVLIIAPSCKENRFWTKSATSWQGPYDQVGVSARYISGPSGYDEINLAPCPFLFPPIRALWAAQNHAASLLNAYSGYKGSITHAAAHWGGRGIFRKLLLETKFQEVLSLPDGQRDHDDHDVGAQRLL